MLASERADELRKIHEEAITAWRRWRLDQRALKLAQDALDVVDWNDESDAQNWNATAQEFAVTHRREREARDRAFRKLDVLAFPAHYERSLSEQADR